MLTWNQTTAPAGEFVLPRFGKLLNKRGRRVRVSTQKLEQKIKIPAKTVFTFRFAKPAKDATPGAKK